jgi:uncharacterized protein (TIGR00251 family)
MMELRLSPGKDGVLVPVRVKPRARVNKIEGVRDVVLLVAVNAPPVEGAANAAVIEVLSKALGCARSTLYLARGEKSRDKIVCVTQLGEEEIRTSLASIF